MERLMLYGLSAYQCVLEFHEIFQAHIGTLGEFPPPDRMALRESLMREELKEFLDEYEAGDYLKAVKELGDLIYVVMGTAVELGLDGDDITNLVHQSNLTKLGEDGKPIFREDGKVMKGPNYRKVTPEMVKAWLEL
jgi:predicted HAD superfamily Cof-like phosphohydrolase